MSYVVHGATLALAWFLATNVVLSLAVAALAGRAGRSVTLSLVLRLLPATASAAFVVGVFIPSYWRFEPREITEGFDLTMTMLAAGAAVLIIGSCARGAVAWRRAVCRAQTWTASAEPFMSHVDGMPAFRVDAPQPVMALVGILRPRLFVTRGLIDALTPEELAASIAHEAGHYHAWDNLKRLAMLGAPDVLRWTTTAHRLEHRWAAAAEHRADAAAADASGCAARLDLASALVKVARLMPEATPIAEPMSTLVGGNEIAARVQRLIDDDAARAVPRGGHPARWAAAVAIAVLAFGYAPLLETVNAATEILVHYLP